MTVPLSVDVGNATLEGAVTKPYAARGLVVFTHGSGSSRHSPRNQLVASKLRDDAVATLLFDLLCPNEERVDSRTGRYRYQIGLLANRLISVLDKVHLGQGSEGLPVGLFGVGRGAAVALQAAAHRPDLVRSIVCSGGRPDLAGKAISGVQAPTLFLVGERDQHMLELNYGAAASLCVTNAVRTIPGVTSKFDTLGALEQVARQAGEWFAKYLDREAEPDTGPA